MKIIFDSEEQKEKFMRTFLGDILTEYCPSSLLLNESMAGCAGNKGTCKECWQESGLVLEVIENA